MTRFQVLTDGVTVEVQNIDTGKCALDSVPYTADKHDEIVKDVRLINADPAVESTQDARFALRHYQPRRIVLP